MSDPYPSLPAYASKPGNAFSERAVWEARFRREMEQELSAHLDALTAAGFPQWVSAVTRMAANIAGFPVSVLKGLLLHEPRDDDPAALADRLARTVATSAYNEHVLSLLAASGAPYKRWVTRRDDEVRPSHAAVDGRAVPLSSPFLVGGALLQYPADSSASPIREWVNCRCVVVAATWVL